MKTGIVIGRFQVPYLHRGHIHLIETVKSNCDNLVIIVGCALQKDERNPYSAQQRIDNIVRIFSNVTFHILYDTPSNEEWCREIDGICKLYSNPTLYGSRDSFISIYTGKIPYKHIEEVPSVTGTQIRESLNKQNEKV